MAHVVAAHPWPLALEGKVGVLFVRLVLMAHGVWGGCLIYLKIEEMHDYVSYVLITIFFIYTKTGVNCFNCHLFLLKAALRPKIGET